MRRVAPGQLELQWLEAEYARPSPTGTCANRAKIFPPGPPGSRPRPEPPAPFDLAAWIASQPVRAPIQPGLVERRREETMRRLAMPPHLIEQALRVRTVAEAWSLWLEHCRGAGLARGCWLVEMFPLGVNLDTSDADKLLVGAEQRGEIQRGAYEPSLEFQFFGLGGRMGPAGGSAPRYPVEWSWMPVPELAESEVSRRRSERENMSDRHVTAERS